MESKPLSKPLQDYVEQIFWFFKSVSISRPLSL
jgi:hypothetical protein